MDDACSISAEEDYDWCWCWCWCCETAVSRRCSLRRIGGNKFWAPGLACGFWCWFAVFVFGFCLVLFCSRHLLQNPGGGDSIAGSPGWCWCLLWPIVQQTSLLSCLDFHHLPSLLTCDPAESRWCVDQFFWFDHFDHLGSSLEFSACLRSLGDCWKLVQLAGTCLAKFFPWRLEAHKNLDEGGELGNICILLGYGTFSKCFSGYFMPRKQRDWTCGSCWWHVTSCFAWWQATKDLHPSRKKP